MLRNFLAALAVLLWTHAATAQSARDVDVELVLAVDISLSMDWDELRLQRDGYAAALRDPAIHALIARGTTKRIALTYFEWAGAGVQKLIVPWTLVDGAASAGRFADAIEQAPISRERMTSISAAIDYASNLFDQSPYKGLRRVLDVSGDGPNNAGRPVTAARDALLDKGVSINGLPIILKTGGSMFDLRDLEIYYADCVIGGPAAFAIAIKSPEEFAPVIRRKMMLEIAGLEPPARLQRTQALSGPPLKAPQQDATPSSRIDCMIGERLWRRYMDGRFPN